MLSELINNSLTSALNFGNQSGNINWNWSNTLQSTDLNQYYRFSLSSSSNFSVALNGLQANANLELLNSNGGAIATGTNPGTTAEFLNRSLAAGNYYIRVYSGDRLTTNYTLQLKGSGAAVDAGNTLSTAFDFGSFTTNTAHTRTESVGPSDPQDIYRVNLLQYSRLSLALGSLSANADLRLLNSSGQVIASSTNPGTTAESLNLKLDTGVYYVQINALAGTTGYNLMSTSSFVNEAPTSLQFGLNKTTLTSTETLSINNAWVRDQNGASDISRVDFQLLRPNNTWLDVSDATSFTPASTDNHWATFNYSLNLNGYAPGNYTLKAIAYDKSGAASNVVNQGFKVNAIPTSLQFSLNKTTFLNTESLNLLNGKVFDGNGAVDLSRIDFRVLLANNTWVDVSDATSFTPAATDNRWATFNYSLNLNGYTPGNYTLWAVAYDKSGAMSTSVSQTFTVQAPVIGDWFSLNLKDQGIIDLTRSLAGDGNLSRTDMISIFRNAEDGNVVDSTELTDLRTIVSNASRFNMADSVRVLSSKIANGDIANTRSGIGNLAANSSSNQLERLIGKWFLGTDRPTAPTGYTMTYQLATGSLFGQDNVFSYQDVKQGYLGDCYFLSSLGAIALQHPPSIRDMFINNGDGSYTVRLFGENNGTVVGTADYLTVDSWLPVNVSGGGYTGQRFAYYDNNNVGLWVALAEKAYAQFAESGKSQRDVFANSYGSIEGGWGYRAMPSITGTNAGYYADTSWSNTGPRSGAFLNLSQISSMLASGKAITADTISNPSGGIVGGHAYFIVGANLSNGTLTVYNPWGVTRSGETNGLRTISYDDFKLNFNMMDVA